MSQVFYYDLYGKREDKYTFLLENDITTVNWQKLKPTEPNNYFVPKDFSNAEDYEKGFKIDELMEVNTSGIKTHHDGELVSRFPFNTEFNKSYCYRPFDILYINYDLEKVERSVFNALGISQNVFNTDGNMSLNISILNDEGALRTLLLQFEIFFDRIV